MSASAEGLQLKPVRFTFVENFPVYIFYFWLYFYECLKELFGFVKTPKSKWCNGGEYFCLVRLWLELYAILSMSEGTFCRGGFLRILTAWLLLCLLITALVKFKNNLFNMKGLP